jgi:hypothetical protein
MLCHAWELISVSFELKRDQFDLFQIEFSFAILLILSIIMKDWAKPPLDHVDLYHLGIRFVGFIMVNLLLRFICWKIEINLLRIVTGFSILLWEKSAVMWFCSVWNQSIFSTKISSCWNSIARSHLDRYRLPAVRQESWVSTLDRSICPIFARADRWQASTSWLFLVWVHALHATSRSDRCQ